MDMEKIFKNSWNVYSNNMVSMILGFLVTMIIVLSVVFASGIIGMIIVFNNPELTLPALFLIVLIALLTVPPFSYGYVHFVNLLRTEKNVKLNEIIAGARKYYVRSIAQTFLFLLILSAVCILVALPFLPSIVDMIQTSYITPTGMIDFSMFTIFFGLIAAELLAMGLVAFILMYWSYAIVIEDTGVFDGLKKAYKVWRNNIGASFVIFLVMMVVSALMTQLGMFSLLAGLLVSPYLVALMVEAYRVLKRKR